MKYCLTVEHTYRIGMEFEATSEEEAKAKAADLANNVSDEIFTGACEGDYALCDEGGRTILDWD